MNSKSGRLQGAILKLIDGSRDTDVGWTTSWLCEYVYGSKRTKSQRVALIRAIKRMRLPPGWKFERGWDELQLMNNKRFYALRRSHHESGDRGD
jgi:hypothetical protein